MMVAFHLRPSFHQEVSFLLVCFRLLVKRVPTMTESLTDCKSSFLHVSTRLFRE